MIEYDESEEHPLVSLFKRMANTVGDADCTTCSQEDCPDRDAEWSGKGDGMPRPKHGLEHPNPFIQECDKHECQDEMDMPDYPTGSNQDINPEAINRHNRPMTLEEVKRERERSLRSRKRMYQTGLKHGSEAGAMNFMLQLIEQILHHCISVSEDCGTVRSDPRFHESLVLVRNVTDDLRNMQQKHWVKLHNKA